MAGFRPFGLLSDYDASDPRNALSYGGGGASGSTPVGADWLGRAGYGFTGVGGVQDAAGLLGGPSLRENLQAGNKFDAALQAAGVVPVAGGAIKGLLGGIHAMSMIPRAAGAASKVAKAADAAEAVTPGITAYHGSPHSFDKFDLSKIGTGEGAQAYGHGLYFADNEDVAKSYREFLSSRNNDLTDPGNLAASLLYRTPEGTREAAIREAQTVINSVDRMPAAYKHDPGVKERTQKALELLQSGAELPKQGGSMYQVRINADPEHFLDWDKPLSEQPAHIQNVVGDVDPNGRISTGLALERWKRSNGVAPDEASRVLAEQGIPGIKYLDQGSRSAGEGSRNYVVFDDKLVEILKKYGLVGLLGGGAAMGSAGQSQPSQQGAPFL